MVTNHHQRVSFLPLSLGPEDQGRGGKFNFRGLSAKATRRKRRRRRPLVGKWVFFSRLFRLLRRSPLRCRPTPTVRRREGREPWEEREARKEKEIVVGGTRRRRRRREKKERAHEDEDDDDGPAGGGGAPKGRRIHEWAESSFFPPPLSFFRSFWTQRSGGVGRALSSFAVPRSSLSTRGGLAAAPTRAAHTASRMKREEGEIPWREGGREGGIPSSACFGSPIPAVPPSPRFIPLPSSKNRPRSVCVPPKSGGTDVAARSGRPNPLCQRMQRRRTDTPLLRCRARENVPISVLDIDTVFEVFPLGAWNHIHL